MDVIITPDHTPHLYNYKMKQVYLSDHQIKTILQFIDSEQLYETNDEVNEYWNTLRMQLNEGR